MAKTFEGVPDTITREDLKSFLANFGFKPEELTNLNIGPEGVTAVVLERDETGARKLNTGGGGYVKHVIRIPVEH